MATTPTFIDYYELLQLAPDADGESIRRACAQLGSMWSTRASMAPSVHKRHEAESKVRLIAEARRVLLDAAERQGYDALRPEVRAPEAPAMEELAALPGSTGQMARGVATLRLSVDLLVAPVLNFAMEQSGVPLIRGGLIRNLGDQVLAGLMLELELTPGLGETYQRMLPPLVPGEDLELETVDYRLPPGRLRQVIESERAALRWRVVAEDGMALTGMIDVDVLAFNHWPGMRAPAGLLASFVLPNDPAIGQVLQRAAAALGQATGDPALDGYQAGSPLRALAMARAIYDAVQSLEIGYADVPASFERQGQKIRLPETVLAERLGCCLDLTVLVAAALEQLQLRPLMILMAGHAFPGVWLVEDGFPEGEVEDAARLRTAIALGQIAVFDSSTMVMQPARDFDAAVAVAHRLLQDDAGFLCALDVRVQRFARFRPLPLRGTAQAGASAPDDEPGRQAPVVVVQGGTPLSLSGPDVAEGVRARFGRWQERLLDLSLRNRLLSFNPDGKSGLALSVPDVAVLEDLVAAGRTFELLPPPLATLGDERDPELARKRIPAEVLRPILIEDMAKGVLHAEVQEGGLAALLKNMDRAARSEFEEGGANVLFLAFGVLRWYETGTSDQARHAPLLLYPVALELDRGKQRYRVRRLAEDPLPNVTLVEKMKRDFGLDLSALNALEPDDSGVDVPAMLRSAREAIQRMPRWEVLEDAYLGLFAFSKFLMWKDLQDNLEVLLASDVVRHLASQESGGFDDGTAWVQPGELDTSFKPDELPCVVDADSTQMAAVASALKGRSFVLQGPPGTGKSQTITNLVAALMAAGKKVLFVSEKMAALEVVHRRLQEVGLGDFCLELHSHKSNKKQVLESLQLARNRVATAAGVPWEERGREIMDIRERLNALTKALHAPRALGLTFHQVLDRMLELRDAPELKFSVAGVATLDAEQWRTLMQAVGDFQYRAAAVDPVEAHAWADTRPGAYTSAQQELIDDALLRAAQALAALTAAQQALGSALGQPLPDEPAALEAIAAIAAVVAEGPLLACMLDRAAWPETARRIRDHQKAVNALEADRAALRARWHEGFLDVDHTVLIAQYREANATHPLIAFFKLWRVKRDLQAHAQSALPPATLVLADLEGMEAQKAEARRIAVVEVDLACALEQPNGVASVDQLAAVLATGERVFQDWRTFLDQLSDWEPRAASLVARSRGDGGPALGEAAAKLRSALSELTAAADALEAGVKPVQGAAWTLRGAPGYREALAAKITEINAAMGRFKAWCQYLAAIDPVTAFGLTPVVEAHAAGQIGASDIVRAVERNVLRVWLVAHRNADEVLSSFDGDDHERLAVRFRELDTEFIGLAKRFCISQVEARLPKQHGAAAESSEPGILERELKKKIRQMPVRKLFQAIPNLVFRLKPCFLMSPISIAQYLPPGFQRFDVIIFDEASQMGTHDAIGAIGRGAQVIIVGDSKQLPPTSFFQRKAEDEGPDENDVVELESVLDEAVAKQLPQQMLGWHYRSRHDSLIDFSNRHYYESKLQIFPAARRMVDGLGVKWHPVPDGEYQSGKVGTNARTNPKEARALVAHLVDALRRTPPGHRSYGVVTFSMSQQNLILDLLEEQRVMHPEIEPHFAGHEGVFVKNLENVQGDERDEIYFSICYAKDENGKLRMLFGPLSSAGGERRLNVAITRARCQLRVFSTLTYDQVDLNRTKSTGSAHLRSFLEFAMRQSADSTAAQAFQRPPATTLEREIQAVLEAHGWTVQAQIGCGEYRVDLAVLHPEEAGVFFIGIETDGAHYHSAETSRDRERLRSQVLESLGWRLHRVWALDWYQNREEQAAKLLAAVDAALDAARRPAPESAPEPVVMAPLSAPPVEATPASVAPPTVAPLAVSPAAAYVPAPLPLRSLDPEAFYATAAGAAVRADLHEVVQLEGPIHVDLACRRVMGCYSLQRLTDRARRRVGEELAALTRLGMVVRLGDFLWPCSLEPDALPAFRAYYPDGTVRDAEHLPPEEIACAASWVLENSLSMSSDDLVREVARHFGLSRVGKNVAVALQAGISLLEARGRCRREGEVLAWAD